MSLLRTVNPFVIELHAGISLLSFELELFRERMLNMENHKGRCEAKVSRYLTNKAPNVLFFRVSVKLHCYRWVNSIIDHSFCEYARENEKNKAKAILKPLPWVVPAHYPSKGQWASIMH